MCFCVVRPPTDDDTNVGQCGAPSCMNPLSINLAIIFGKYQLPCRQYTQFLLNAVPI